MFDMIRQAQVLKEKMAQFQKELEAQSFTGTAGDGAVTVTVNGKHEVRSVMIDPRTAASGDGAMIADLVKTALNDAGSQVNKKLKEEVGKMTGGLIPPGLL
ncbi:MAG TPA: YbaB/EbfC family nucleoid-associated protein [bacterium]|nr:YbaB/EbfC family nucleoid-associated protein [bacterium]